MTVDMRRVWAQVNGGGSGRGGKIESLSWRSPEVTVKALALAAVVFATPVSLQAQTLTLVGLSAEPKAVTRQEIEALGLTELKDAREVSSGGQTQRIETTYAGIELPRLLDAFGFEQLDRYAVRSSTILVTAKDAYRASFSWGELFNAPGGQRVFVILKENGQPLPARAGHFSLRAFGDLRPGPRHVRDAVEIRVVLSKQ